MSIDIKVGDTVVYNISDLELTLLKSYINEDNLQSTIENMVMCLVMDTCNHHAYRFKNEWINKLQQDETLSSVPLSNQAFVDMVIARDDYKTQKVKDNSL